MKIFLKAFPFLHKPINKLTNGSNADDAFQNCSRARCHAISINHALCSGHQISLTSSRRGAGHSSWELQRMVMSFSLEKMAVKVHQIGVTHPHPRHLMLCGFLACRRPSMLEWERMIQTVYSLVINRFWSTSTNPLNSVSKIIISIGRILRLWFKERKQPSW